MNSIIYWGNAYILSGIFINILITNLFKESFLEMAVNEIISDVIKGKITGIVAAKRISILHNNFFIISIIFSILSCLWWIIIIFPTLFGKNPFSQKNS